MKKGFTLIEVLGAIVILTVALIPLIGLVQGILVISQKQEWETKTLFYAQQKMEEIIALQRSSFSNVAPSPGTVEGNYKFLVQYTAEPGISDRAMIIVKVTVWYDENQAGTLPGPGETQTTLSNIITNRGR